MISRKNKKKYILHKIQASVSSSFKEWDLIFAPAVCGHMQDDALFHIFSLVTVDEVLYEPNISFRELRLKRVKS